MPSRSTVFQNMATSPSDSRIAPEPQHPGQLIQLLSMFFLPRCASFCTCSADRLLAVYRAFVTPGAASSTNSSDAASEGAAQERSTAAGAEPERGSSDSAHARPSSEAVQGAIEFLKPALRYIKHVFYKHLFSPDSAPYTWTALLLHGDRQRDASTWCPVLLGTKGCLLPCLRCSQVVHASRGWRKDGRPRAP